MGCREGEHRRQIRAGEKGAIHRPPSASPRDQGVSWRPAPGEERVVQTWTQIPLSTLTS